MAAGLEANRKLRVLLVQTQAEMAGAQEISRLLSDGLARAGPAGEPAFDMHNLFLYRKTAGCDDFPNVRFAARTRPSTPLSALRFGRELLRTMRDVRPDAVLAFQHYGNIVAAPVARLSRVPLVVANHVSAPATINAAVRGIDRVLGLTGFYDVVTVNSRETWRDYSHYPQRYRDRIVHVPHGFAERATTMSKAQARQAYGLPVDARVIGTVARLHALKRIDLAIEALARLPRIHLAIAGQGPDLGRLVALAERLGVSERVHFAGEMASERVGDFLAALDLFVFPSEAETFGLAAVEAAQAGVPVIANDLAVLREVLEYEGAPCARFVDAADIDAFAAGIGDLLADRAAATELGRRGRLLSNRFSAAAMVEAYRRLVLDHTSPRLDIMRQERKHAVAGHGA